MRMGNRTSPSGWEGRREVPKITEPDSRAEEEVDILLGLVRQRYGSRLTAAELDGVRQGIQSIVTAARALRAVRLRNADEPVPPFVPVREDP
jgi:hypothetical protein